MSITFSCKTRVLPEILKLHAGHIIFHDRRQEKEYNTVFMKILEILQKDSTITLSILGKQIHTPKYTIAPVFDAIRKS